MFLTLPLDEARVRLHALGLRLLRTEYEGTTEVWLTPNGEELYLLPELDGTGAYEEETIKAIEAALGSSA